MHSGSSVVLSAQPFSVATGIASIILEGRSLSDDDFHESDIGSFLVQKSSNLQQDARLQKLQQIRSDGDTNNPGTSKDFIGCTIKTENIILEKNKHTDLGTLQSLATSCLSTTKPPLLLNRDFPQPPSQLNYCSYQTSKKKTTTSKIPRQGPHCEHFLKFIGVIKTDDVDENFEHFCNESNDYCARWQNYLRQLQLILCSEPICIEVFIGPENNAILMEQWIIKIVEKASGTHLPLSSLCSAIRSQLHFSQISSWTDLLKTSCDSDFFDNPRIRKTNKLGKPKLDILYRIKTFDSTSCFNEKPLVHEFPEAAITEKYSISVCLKSSPRCKSIPNFLQQVFIDNDLETNRCCNEKGKHNCTSAFETKDMINNLEITSPSSSTTHREKQLLKYKKRLLKYEKKTVTGNDDNNYRKHENNFSINSIRPPLYNTLQRQTNIIPFYNNLTDTTKSTQTANTEMITTGTQTEVEEYCVCLNSDLFQENSSMDKSDLLLQSIRRTGVVNSISCHRRLKSNLCDNKLSSSNCDNSTSLDQVDCRLCKRQKTKHNFINNSPNSFYQTKNLLFSHRPYKSSCQCLKEELNKHKVRPNNFNNNNTITDLNKLKICSPFNDRMFIEESQFQTPTNSIIKSTWEMGNSTKLSIDRSRPIGKNIPKVNLTQKFNENPEVNLSPTSPLLSPFSAKNLISAAILKRRSRHLSEISSERSSIGSEEHISDEEFGNFSPVFLSPNKTSKSYFAKEIVPFGKRALLGCLEESLLQKCFTPKFTIYGFKVLLGASGQFCPTQLTIPVVTSLYELKSQTLTTPYMCEIPLPRKGYSIPRHGTVQTTLLNSQGTVVRMFVVPYNFSDMPSMCTTFLRQRVLACPDNLVSKENDLQMTNAEQMKLLRYVIHLRFQTSRSGRLLLHSDIKLLICRRIDTDSAAAHAKGVVVETTNGLKVITIFPTNPTYSPRIDKIERK